MNHFETQWKAIKKHAFISRLCWFSFAFLLSTSTNAQTGNCPPGDPLQWTWIQNLIEQDGGCVAGIIQQFEYNGDTYISASPGATENGQPCPSDNVFSRYTCQGDFICSFGVVNGTGCDPEFENAARVGTTIWVYDDSPQSENCPTGDPLQWSWIQSLIESKGGCEVGAIQQYEYNGNTFIRTTIGGFENGIPCPADHRNVHYTCEGNWICETGGVTPLDRWCEQDIINSANNNSTTLWVYEDIPTQGSCNTHTGTFFYADCGGISYYFIELEDGRIFDPYFAEGIGITPEEGQQIRFDFEIKTDVTTPCTISESPITITCFETIEPGNEPICSLPWDPGELNCSGSPSLRYYYNNESNSCQSIPYGGCGGNANNYETYGECINACNSVMSCPAGDPLQWDWIQNIINEWDYCRLGSISLQEYSDGNSYVYVYPGNEPPHTGIGPPPAACLSGNPIYRSFTCQGTLLCTFEPVHYPPCTMGDLGELVNTTNIWTREYDCANPFDLSIVQQAIVDGCTNAIYTFDYEGASHIYFERGCDYMVDVLYNCNTAQNVSLINAVQPFLNDENAIWTNDCTYETMGTVYYSENCGLYIGCCLDSQFQIATLPEDIELLMGQIVEFSYEPATDEICLPLGQPVDITCIRTVADDCGCPPVSKSFSSVCGLDGNTYDTACLANCYANGVAYEGECRDCNSENPLQEEWIKNIIINSNNGCYTSEIKQFTYNGAVYFQTIAGESGVDCFADVPDQYYDCFGNLICKTGGVTPLDLWCDATIIAAAGSGTAIWTYSEADCTNPLETDFVQSWLNSDCTPEAIYSFEFEGETFIYVEPGVYCFDYYADEANLFYNCNAGITCNLTSAFLGYYDFSCFGINELFLESSLISDNLIWTKPCEYEVTGKVINISDYIPSEYLYDEDCDLVIDIQSMGNLVSLVNLPDDFTLTVGQVVEFTYLNIFPYQEGACSDVQPVEIICIREAGNNQNTMDRIECPQDHTTSICAPVNIPASMSMQDFSTSNDPTYMNSMQMQMEEQTEVNKYFNTTTRVYTISDESGNQKTCETKHHIANQFLQMPEVSEPSTICEEDLWSYVKVGTDQYMLYSDHNGSKGTLMSTCNTPSLVCSTADLGVDTNVSGKYHFWASTYFEFPDGSICESEAMPFYVDVQAKPVAALSASNQSVNIGEGFALMDLVTTNKSGYWSGENIVYLMTATGENIAYFSSNTVGVNKLYYTVRNDNCEQSYLLIVEVASAGKATPSDQTLKTTDATFNIYPNPTSHKFFIDLPNRAIYQINLMDISGKIMKQVETKTEDSTIEINANDIPKGMYLVELQNASNHTIQKLIVE